MVDIHNPRPPDRFSIYLLLIVMTISLWLLSYRYIQLRVRGETNQSQQQSIIKDFTTPRPTATNTPTPTITSVPGGGSLSLSGDIANPDQVKSDIQPCLDPANVEIYKYAQSKTGVPWQVLAGIHYREGGCRSNASLVSGRPIGGDEPDVDAGGGCAAGGGEGDPHPVPGGCGFSTLRDTAVFAGRHLLGKVPSGKVDTQPELMRALRGYNGTGNDNCTDAGVSKYGEYCFPCAQKTITGDDHNYVMNYYDTGRHVHMCIIYCADGRVCGKLSPDANAGALTVAKVLGLGSSLVPAAGGGSSAPASPGSAGAYLAPPAIEIPPDDIHSPEANLPQVCPPAGQKVTASGAIVSYLANRQECIKPTTIVLHWSSQWLPASGANSTQSILDRRGLSCQFAVDENGIVQLLDLYDELVERSSCVLGNNNETISIEISGSEFDGIYNNPADPHFAELQKSSDNVFALSCWLMKQYNISVSHVVGHLTLNPGKNTDPGAAYLEYMRTRLYNECK